MNPTDILAETKAIPGSLIPIHPNIPIVPHRNVSPYDVSRFTEEIRNHPWFTHLSIYRILYIYILFIINIVIYICNYSCRLSPVMGKSWPINYIRWNPRLFTKFQSTRLCKPRWLSKSHHLRWLPWWKKQDWPKNTHKFKTIWERKHFGWMGFQYCNICNMSISLLKLKHEVFFPPRHTFRQWLRSKSNSRTLLRTSLAETLSSDILIAANCTALAACSPKVLTAGFRCPCSFFRLVNDEFCQGCVEIDDVYHGCRDVSP